MTVASTRLRHSAVRDKETISKCSLAADLWIEHGGKGEVRVTPRGSA